MPIRRAICAAFLPALLLSCGDWGQSYKPHLLYDADFSPSRIGEAEALVREIAERRSLYLFEKEDVGVHFNPDELRSLNMVLFHDEEAFERKRDIMWISSHETGLSISVPGTDFHGRPIDEVDLLAAEVKAGFEDALGLEFCLVDPLKSICPPSVNPYLLYHSDLKPGMAEDAKALMRDISDKRNLPIYVVSGEELEKATGRADGFEIHLYGSEGQSRAQDALTLVSTGVGGGVTLAAFDLSGMSLWDLDSVAHEAKSELQRRLGLAFCRADLETGACDARHAALEAQREIWLRVRESNDPADLEAFLAEHPDSSHAEAAHRRLAQLQASAPKEAFAWKPLRRGAKFRDPLADGGRGPEMAAVPPGAFLMGCVSRVGCRNAERPVREVQLARPFALAVREVTFAEYFLFANPDAQPEEPWADRPAVHLSWEEAAAYAQWLSAQTGRRYRLPSEAEWEYAARAGSGAAYAWGDTIGERQAHCSWDCIGGMDTDWTMPVGFFAANALGFHDMHGNAAEWTADCWSEDLLHNPADGGAYLVEDCRRRSVRGGSYRFRAAGLRSAARAGRRADRRHIDVGFRVARDLAPAEPAWPLGPSAAVP